MLELTASCMDNLFGDFSLQPLGFPLLLLVVAIPFGAVRSAGASLLSCRHTRTRRHTQHGVRSHVYLHYATGAMNNAQLCVGRPKQCAFFGHRQARVCTEKERREKEKNERKKENKREKEGKGQESMGRHRRNNQEGVPWRTGSRAEAGSPFTNISRTVVLHTHAHTYCYRAQCIHPDCEQAW